jgi:hypothetical protein
VKLGLHIVTSLVTPYEIHRDAFLYFAMGEHLSLFQMDFPPAIALLAELVRGLLGDSLFAIRLVPATFGTATVVLAVLIARELGGGRFAQGMAAVCVLANPLFLRSSVLFQPVVLDQFAWTLGFYALARLSRTDDVRWWIALGVATGFGLLAKFTIGVFGVAVVVALVLTRGFTWLRDRGPWLALALAVIIGSPSIIGQIGLELPVLSYMADLREAQLVRVSAVDFITGQVTLGPTSLLAAAGVIFLLISFWCSVPKTITWLQSTPWRTLEVRCCSSSGRAHVLQPLFAGRHSLSWWRSASSRCRSAYRYSLPRRWRPTPRGSPGSRPSLPTWEPSSVSPKTMRICWDGGTWSKR